MSRTCSAHRERRGEHRGRDGTLRRVVLTIVDAYGKGNSDLEYSRFNCFLGTLYMDEYTYVCHVYKALLQFRPYLATGP